MIGCGQLPSCACRRGSIVLLWSKQMSVSVAVIAPKSAAATPEANTGCWMQWRVGGRAGIIDNGAEAARIYHAQR